MKLNRKLIWISILYFAEGLPYGIIEHTFVIYFRDHGVSLGEIGILSLVGFTYALKFLWAPAVDFIGKRRHWIAAMQFLLAIFLILLIPLDPSEPGFALWGCIILFAIFSATQDIAIDAYSIEMLKPSEMGIANGFRISAYRMALLVTGGLSVVLAAKIGWEATYIAAAVVMLICSVLSWRLPPVEVARRATSLFRLVEPLRDFFIRPGVVYVVAFILLYKIGDFALGPMARTFWLDRGLSLEEIGYITGTVGVVAAILGGLAGGVFTSRFGIFHGLWFLGLCQPIGNLTYWLVALYPETGNWGVYAASMAESFCSGLGTAAFLAFLMSICNKEFSATQYALLAAFFNISGRTSAALSGFGVERFGYADYFGLTLLASFPVFLFIFHARAWIPPENSGPRTASNNRSDE